MVEKYHNFRKSAELFGTICGGLLLSLPVIPQALAQQSTSQQQPTGQVNPCPRIFYEEPHNSRVVVPQGCPPNALTQRLAAQGLLPVPATPSPEQAQLGVGGEASPVPPKAGDVPSSIPQVQGQASPVPPEPGATVPVEPRQTPSATIALANGKLNIRLVNQTAANITYQVIGDTAPRSLEGKSDITLQNLSAPITVTFERQDGGQLIVTPQASSEPGNLEVTFNEATNAVQGRSAMRVERSGSVYLN
ncbi:hypothetical protein [Nostoc sp. PA-18-2419]|uniref:hypothetical protein n=1 Tax=Nostoc sp. PA-18-2419 TaxID=2575443 RepID=UPI001109FBD6|nr:hypothetical protein [Nostoc sp. PA-18-2419]